MRTHFPGSGATATLTLRERGKDPIEMDMSLLQLSAGDTIVFRLGHDLPVESSERIREWFDSTFADRGVKAIVLAAGAAIEDVWRGSECEQCGAVRTEPHPVDDVL